MPTYAGEDVGCLVPVKFAHPISSLPALTVILETGENSNRSPASGPAIISYFLILYTVHTCWQKNIFSVTISISFSKGTFANIEYPGKELLALGGHV